MKTDMRSNIKPEMILAPKFVQYIPDALDPGILYVSMEFATASHQCVCGCGSEVVTPLSPTFWTLIFDGTVSLDPSIGNWSFPCRSHYWIEKNRVVWAPQWSKEQIKSARAYDALRRQEHFEAQEGDVGTDLAGDGQMKVGFWQRVKKKIFRR
jgi:Family of unknown function (DUF6527)